MFVQATKSRRQNKTYVSYLVRESFRTSEGPRTVCNISALPPEVRDLVAAARGLATLRIGEAFCRGAPISPAPASAGHDLWSRPVSVR